MKLTWEIDDDDVSRVRAFFERHRDNWFVTNELHSK